MPGTLPVPLSCELPEDWQAAPPDEVGAPQAAFVGLHMPSHGQGFMPNITVTGRTLQGAASLHTIAEESVKRLREYATEVKLVKRTEVGTSEAPGLIDAPGLVQNLYLRTTVNGEEMELAQSQFLLILENEVHRSERVEIEVALTAKRSQLPDVLDDYKQFLASLQQASPSDDA